MIIIYLWLHCCISLDMTNFFHLDKPPHPRTDNWVTCTCKQNNDSTECQIKQNLYSLQHIAKFWIHKAPIKGSLHWTHFVNGGVRQGAYKSNADFLLILNFELQESTALWLLVESYNQESLAPFNRTPKTTVSSTYLNKKKYWRASRGSVTSNLRV